MPELIRMVDTMTVYQLGLFLKDCEAHNPNPVYHQDRLFVIIDGELPLWIKNKWRNVAEIKA